MSEEVLSSPNPKGGRLTGKVALVTGAGGVIGAGIASTLAARGGHVACVDIDIEAARRTAATVQEEGGAATSYGADSSDRGSVQALISKVADDLGGLDVLVNNAMWIRYQPLSEVDEETLDRMLGIGVKAVLWTIQSSLPLMRRAGKGSIVNIASLAALRGTANSSVYGAVKGGVVALTQHLAVELGPDRIRVNAVAPGLVPTPGALARLGPEGYQKRLDATPLGRFGIPSDIAEATAFLASDSSAFMTGQTMVLDGGRSSRA